jgi:diguanylate cyclase (GGDEF)-like protein/PAS domain S-box-containing protein
MRPSDDNASDFRPAGLAVPLPYAQDQYQLLFDSNPVPMWVFDRKTLRFLDVNKATVRQYGFTRAEFLGMTVLEIRPPETIPELVEDIAHRQRGLQDPGSWIHRRKDGTLFEVEIVCHDLTFRGADALLVAAHDTTARNQAQRDARQAEEKYRSIFENAVIGIFQHSFDGHILSVNPALAHMHGYESPEQLQAEVSNVAAQLFVYPERMMEIARAAEHGVIRNAEVELYRKDRSRIWVLVNLRAVRGINGDFIFEGTAEDITERKAAEAQVRFLAWHDALTGLPNRALFADRLDTALAAALRAEQKVAVLFLDLDRFKNINDSLGHSIGDQMLQAVAERFRQSVRAVDTVARLSGDEFLILLPSITSASEAEGAARRILQAVGRSFTIRNHRLGASCSIGIALFPDHGADGETLIRNADAAMYSAKEMGSSRVRFFTQEMNQRATRQLNLENDLRAALGAREFSLVYQPQKNLATGAVVGMEALLRWQHPTLGLVLPGDFISVAESSGLILPIGEWVLRTACSLLGQWRQEGRPIIPVAVNVSVVQFRHQEFCSLIRSVLMEADLPPRFLELELTESVLLSNADVMVSVLEELQDMGVNLAIDDFGTGYSSLSYLKQFRAARLKIDKSFVRDLATNPDDAAIASAIISMAKSLNMRVLAEGVETEAQIAFLRQHRCDEIQGYYISWPLPAPQIADFLSASAPAEGF